MTDYWQDLLEASHRISVYSRVEREYNVDHFAEVTFNQFGNLIDCALQGYGYDRFVQKLAQRKTKPNPKYDGLLPEIWSSEAEYAEAQKKRRQMFED